MIWRQLISDASEYSRTLVWYAGRKVGVAGSHFEGAKGIVVGVLKARRGTYQKPFLHVGMVFLVVLAVSGGSVLVNRYPSKALAQSGTGEEGQTAAPESVDITNIDTVTQESDKPRRDVITYTVEGGDTLSSIARKFSNEKLGINLDAASIAYLNGFSVGKVLAVGDKIKIPPVSGVIIKVKSGDTIYSLAKKYGLPSPQPIVDWPYNNFVDDEKFSLAAGQELVIPGGKPPEERPAPVQNTPKSSLFGAPAGGGSGQFAWPIGGAITQYFAWYHTGVDIAGPGGSAVTVADGGRVVSVLYQNYGYGYHVIVDHGNSYTTLYGHLSRIDVAVGENVSRGQQLGLRGSTGRSTGPHLHFEIRKNGAFQNPLSYLR